MILHKWYKLIIVRSKLILPSSFQCVCVLYEKSTQRSKISHQTHYQCLILRAIKTPFQSPVTQQQSNHGAHTVDAHDDDFARAIEARDKNLNNNSSPCSPEQFSNPDNVERGHIKTRPKKSRDLRALGLSWDAFVHVSDTCGTIKNVRKFVCKESPSSVDLMAQPAESPQGIQGITDG